MSPLSIYVKMKEKPAENSTYYIEYKNPIGEIIEHRGDRDVFGKYNLAELSML